MQQIDINFKEQKPNRIVKNDGLTAEEKRRYELLDNHASFIAKNFLFSIAGLFHLAFPEKKEASFVIKIVDNEVFYLYTLYPPDFHDLIKYAPLKISDPIEVWNRVGEQAEQFGINEYDVLDNSDIRLYYIDFTSKEYLNAYNSCLEPQVLQEEPHA